MMVTEKQLRACSEAFFDAFSENTPSIKMLHHFSTTSPTVVQHTHVECPHPLTSRVTGSHGIRSYFDLLATHWARSGARIRDEVEVDVCKRRVTIPASVTWTWRKSCRSWKEDFTWTLDFDDSLKISSFIIRTMSSPGTCVMRAIDCDPAVAPKEQKACSQASVSSTLALIDCVFDVTFFLAAMSFNIPLYPRCPFLH